VSAPFTTVRSRAAILNISNLDTDRLVPARFLHHPRSLGYGQFLLHDLRFDAEGNERADFVLNQPLYRDARILIAADNFGCGSSRESAVWALHGYGFRVIIASSFGDIYFENSCRNGLLNVTLGEPELNRLRQTVARHPDGELTVDLAAQTIGAPDASLIRFEFDATKKKSLLLGLDDIGQTLELTGDIEKFEARCRQEAPWLSLHSH
jgi:3-isopropylmalate/(R)-2-methylmalate dehydratase small subunit